MVSEDVVGVVARGIYSEILKCQQTQKVWFETLPVEARQFLRDQARSGMAGLRQNVTDGMVDAALDLDDPDPRAVFVAMLDAALQENIN